MCLIHHIGGAFTRKPQDLSTTLSQKASDLIKRAFDDVDPRRLVDHHVHIAGVGAGDTNAFVNAKMHTWAHPFHRLKFKVYMSSAGINDEQRGDAEFVERLASLVSSIGNHGYITAEEGDSIKEIYQYNPLLFDFTLKRTLKDPETRLRLPASVFMRDPAE